MPIIYLNKTKGYYFTATFVRVNVSNEKYKPSTLFNKHKHHIEFAIKEDILIYKRKLVFKKYFINTILLWKIKLRSHYKENYLTITTGKGNPKAKLKEAYVYYNVYDPKKTPLLLVLMVENDQEPKVDNKYYKASDFNNKFTGGQSEDISKLSTFKSDDDILNVLLKENDLLEHILTYDIGKKQGDNGENELLSDEYNGKKITIVNDSPLFPDLPSSRFKRFKHSPKHNYTTKNACVIYNNNLLFGEYKKTIESIMDKKYDYINVFWSDNVGEPLLLELKQGEPEPTSSNKYYYHTWIKDKSLYWKEITESGNVLDVQFYQNEIDGFNHINGFDNKKLLDLLKAIEAHLLKTVVFMIDKKVQYKLNDFKFSFKNYSKYRLINTKVKVEDNTKSEKNCINKYGYKVYGHDFTSSVKGIEGDKEKVEIKFIISKNDSSGKYQEITLYQNEFTQYPVERLYNIITKNKVYVYFYGDDPRPLLLCYNGVGYAPKDKETYFTEWAKVDVGSASPKLTECGCPQDQVGHLPEDKNTLLKELDKVVKFLNQVNLKEGTSETGGNGRDTHTYEVQKFKGQKIQIEVKCSTVGDTSKPPAPQSCSSSNNKLCYKKFEHKPIGMRDMPRNGTGFRLGQVEYNGGGGSIKSTLDYPNLASKYKYDPLVGITVFYYEHDKGFNDPLLIELEFKKNGGGGGAGPKEYYKLTTTKDSRSSLQWIKEEGAEGKMKSNPVDHLDSIRYSVKKVIMIQIDQNKDGSYKLKGRPSSCLSQSGFSDSGYDKKIQVVECNEGACSKLKEKNYICFQHKLTKLQPQDYHQIGGVVMTLKSNKGDTYGVEIPIYNENQGGEGSNGQQKYLYYNSCMGDVYVYFYCKKGSKTPDTVPLMVLFNGKFYEPPSRDEYLQNWSHQLVLKDVKKPCGSELEEIENIDLISGMLNLINKALNRIDLTKTIDYGIPKPKGPPSPTKEPQINLDRVKVTTIQGEDKRPYTKLVHRTINDFTIGEIWYESKDITKGGVQIKNGGPTSGSTTITVDQNSGGTKNHTSFVSSNKPNTVVVYYSTTDKHFKLPQLILIMTTDEPIKQDCLKPITASTTNKKYGYYIINHSDDHCIYFEYDWIQPTDNPPPKPLTLDDPTELSLLNSVVILLEQKPKIQTGRTKTSSSYSDDKIDLVIKNLIDSNSITPSPGLDKDINRLKGKEVLLKEETGEGKGDPCLKNTGFKAITHDISEIVDPKIHGAPNVTLIAILRFLIPTSEGDGKYIPLNLYDSLERKQIVTLFHQNNQNCLCVYFYGQDPRPLLLSYNNNTFRPESKSSYFYKWPKDMDISSCKSSGKDEKLVQALVRVSNFLNQVNIKKGIASGKSTRTYYVDKFNGEWIEIVVTGKSDYSEKFCYMGYTHTHNGIAGSGKGGHGFRLGNITYNFQDVYEQDQLKNCITSLLDPPDKYNSASQIVVYYYKLDTIRNNPLLVALCKKDNGGTLNSIGATTSICKCKPYYELQRNTKGESIKKIYKKVTDKDIDLNDRKGGDLEKLLDKILFYVSNSILINLSFRVRTDVKYHGERGKSILTIKHNTYQAKVYENESEYKLTKRHQTLKVQVSDPTDIKTSSGEKTGYMCYKHKLTTISYDQQIRGLRLFLWDNRSIEKDVDCEVTKNNTQEKKICCEIDLYGDGSQTSAGSSTNCKIDPIAYTTCKGDLYVYFYGSDPRPLLLCYNGQAYKPSDLETYSQRWCQVKEIEACECGIEGFDPEKSGLLKTLYGVSMFLNPVKLSETIAAYGKVKPESESVIDYLL